MPSLGHPQAVGMAAINGSEHCGVLQVTGLKLNRPEDLDDHAAMPRQYSANVRQERQELGQNLRLAIGPYGENRNLPKPVSVLSSSPQDHGGGEHHDDRRAT